MSKHFDEPKRYTIYKITNSVNGKVYIGQTRQSTAKRFRKHVDDARRGKITTFHNAIRLHGESSFYIEEIFNVFLESDLNVYEEIFIQEHNCCILDGKDNGYNMTRGGTQSKITSEQASANNKTRSANGTNPFAGIQGSTRSKAIQKERMANGTHHNQIRHCCQFCRREIIGPAIAKHESACLENPINYGNPKYFKTAFEYAIFWPNGDFKYIDSNASFTDYCKTNGIQSSGISNLINHGKNYKGLDVIRYEYIVKRTERQKNNAL